VRQSIASRLSIRRHGLRRFPGKACLCRSASVARCPFPSRDAVRIGHATYLNIRYLTIRSDVAAMSFVGRDGICLIAANAGARVRQASPQVVRSYMATA
jgi:hypothetical protein